MVLFYEKSLEEYTCKNLRKLVATLYSEPLDTVTAWVLGTQIPTSAGVIDALIVIGIDLYIVEFKALRATQKDLGQLLRYRSAVRQLTPYRVLKGDDFYDDGMIRAVEQLNDVKLMLIAPSFTREALLGADVCVEVDWFSDRSGDTFTYKAVGYSESHYNVNPQLQEIVNPYLAFLVDTHRKELKRRAERDARESADNTD